MVYSVQVPKDFIKKGNNLSVNATKILYYAVGKAQAKAISIKAQKKDISIMEIFEEEQNQEILLTMQELREVFKSPKMNKSKLIKPIEELTTSEYKAFFKDMFVSSSGIEFKAFYDLVELLNEVDEIQSNNKVKILELFELKSKYSINLYLYCLTLYRGSWGNIQISIENLKNILCPEGTSQTDKMFIQRYIKKPIEEITASTNCKIGYTRAKDNIKLKVSQNKIEEVAKPIKKDIVEPVKQIKREPICKNQSNNAIQEEILLSICELYKSEVCNKIDVERSLTSYSLLPKEVTTDNIYRAIYSYGSSVRNSEDRFKKRLEDFLTVEVLSQYVEFGQPRERIYGFA